VGWRFAPLSTINENNRKPFRAGEKSLAANVVVEISPPVGRRNGKFVFLGVNNNFQFFTIKYFLHNLFFFINKGRGFAFCSILGIIGSDEACNLN